MQVLAQQEIVGLAATYTLTLQRQGAHVYSIICPVLSLSEFHCPPTHVMVDWKMGPGWVWQRILSLPCGLHVSAVANLTEASPSGLTEKSPYNNVIVGFGLKPIKNGGWVCGARRCTRVKQKTGRRSRCSPIHLRYGDINTHAAGQAVLTHSFALHNKGINLILFSSRPKGQRDEGAQHERHHHVRNPHHTVPKLVPDSGYHSQHH